MPGALPARRRRNGRSRTTGTRRKSSPCFRLSSKSHWDVPIKVNGEIVHVLAAHPTPPVFDGPEDRNGLRNHDEIRFWDDYVTPGAGRLHLRRPGRHAAVWPPASASSSLATTTPTRTMATASTSAIQQILDRIRRSMRRVVPTSPGGVRAVVAPGRRQRDCTPETRRRDTADFADTTPGNLRVDYVLPSQVGLDPIGGSVFWPLDTDPTFPLVGTFDPAFPGASPAPTTGWS